MGYITRQYVDFKRDVMRVCILIVLMVCSAATVPRRKCWHHASVPGMLVDKELEWIQVALMPIERAAVELSQLPASNQCRIDMAHKLLRVHDRFEATCYDHEWDHSLAHKLCAVYVRHSDEFGELGNLTGYPIARCLSIQHKVIRKACREHVTPWTPEHTVCSTILRHAECRERHPLAGMCTHRTAAGAPAAEPARFAHSQHGTQQKHSGWRSKTKADAASRNVVQIQTDTPRRQGGGKAGPSSQSTGEQLHLAVLIPPESELTARTVASAPGITVCADSGLRTLISLVYPRLKPEDVVFASGIDKLAEKLTTGACVAIVTWRSVAEFANVKPCTIPAFEARTHCKGSAPVAFAHGYFKDPEKQRVSIRGSIKDAANENVATASVCKRYNNDTPAGDTTSLQLQTRCSAYSDDVADLYV